MVATDGHRLAYVEIAIAPASTGKVSFRALGAAKAMAEIVKLADESGADSKLVFAGDDNHLFFEFGERLLITRKLTGNFPDYEKSAQGQHHIRQAESR
jgi:DNA polymerase III subunit beta